MQRLLNNSIPIRPGSALAAAFWEHGRSADCPIYDMHGHMGPFPAIYFPLGDADAMVRHMDAAGVAMLCFAPHASLFAPDIGNAPAIAAVRRHPARLRAYLSINPHDPGRIADDLARFDEYRDVFVGLKCLSDYHRVPLSDDRYREALEFADRQRLLVLLHTWSNSGYDGPGEVRTIAARHPHATFLLAHCFNNDWAQAVAVAREHPNTYLDLTSLMGLRGVVELLVRGVGSDRIVYGTDLPWFDEHQGIGSLLAAEIDEADIHNICHRNARRLLAL